MMQNKMIRICFFRQKLPLVFKLSNSRVYAINPDVPPSPLEESNKSADVNQRASNDSVQNAANPEMEYDTNANNDESRKLSEDDASIINIVEDVIEQLINITINGTFPQNEENRLDDNQDEDDHNNQEEDPTSNQSDVEYTAVKEQELSLPPPLPLHTPPLPLHTSPFTPPRTPTRQSLAAADEEEEESNFQYTNNNQSHIHEETLTQYTLDRPHHSPPPVPVTPFPEEDYDLPSQPPPPPPPPPPAYSPLPPPAEHPFAPPKPSRQIQYSEFNEEAGGLLKHLTHLPPSSPQYSPEPSTPCSYTWQMITGLSNQVHMYEVYGINGVRVLDLDRDFQLLLVRQAQRPIILDLIPLRYSLPLEEEIKSNKVDALHPYLSSSIITYEMFLAQYNNSACTKLRKQVGTLLTDYKDCDWNIAKIQHNQCAYETIVSIYKYIEQEMKKLELFNGTHKRGKGMPTTLSEEDERAIRSHIERFVFSQIASFTKTLWPTYKSTEYPPYDMQRGYIDKHMCLQYAGKYRGEPLEELMKKVEIEVGSEHEMQTRLAFYRFITLEHLGLQMKTGNKVKAPTVTTEDQPEQVHILSHEGVDAISKYYLDYPYALSLPPSNQPMIFQEEWYLLMKAMYVATTYDIPADILAIFTKINKLVSYAVDAFLHRSHLHGIICSSCQRCHVCCLVQNTLEEGMNESVGVREMEFTAKEELVDFLVKNKDEAIVKDLYAFQSTESSLEYTAYSLSADDLLPAIIYTLIQANPPQIEYIIFLCTEYRHPYLLTGEEQYILTQLSSAISFIYNCTVQQLDIHPIVYNRCLLRYKDSSMFLTSCIQHHNIVQQLQYHFRVNPDLDLEISSTDYLDNIWTYAIKNNSYPTLQYLCEHFPGRINAYVGLFHGKHERITPLFHAVMLNHPHLVVLLLDYGADRAKCSYRKKSILEVYNSMYGHHQNTNRSTNDSIRYHLMLSVLLGDKEECNLIESILVGDWQRVVGLSIQSIDLQESFLTPYMACVGGLRVDMLKLLLCNTVQKAPVNELKAGETVLLVAVKMFCYYTFQYYETQSREMLASKTPSTTPPVSASILQVLHLLYQMIAILLRYGADRYQKDREGNNSLYYILSLTQTQSAFPIPHSPSLTSAYPAPSSPQSRDFLLSPIVLYLLKRRGVSIEESAEGCLSPSPHSSSPPIVSPSTPLLPPPHFDEQFSALYSSLSVIGDIVTEVQALLSTDPLHPALLHHLGSAKEFITTPPSPPLPPSSPPLPVFEYAKEKHYHTLKALLLQGYDLNLPCPQTMYTPLIAACHNQDLPLVRLLTNMHMHYAFTNLEVCSCYHIVKAFYSLFTTFPSVNHLVQKQSCTHKVTEDCEVQINAQTSTHMTALHYAALHDNRPIATLLLRRPGIIRYMANYKQHTAYDLCVQRGFNLLANMIKYDPNKISICLAMQHHDMTVLEALYHQLEDINTTKVHHHPQTNQLLPELHSPLITAAAYNWYDLVKYCLDCKEVNINIANKKGFTALHYACFHQNEKIILSLLAAGCNRYHVDEDKHVAKDYITHSHKLAVYNYEQIHPPTEQPPKKSAESLIILLSVDPKVSYIHEYIYQKDYKATVAMLKQGVDVNHARYTLTMQSNMVGSIPLPPSTSKASPSASVKKRRSSTKTVLPDFESLFIEGETPLIAAAKVNATDIMGLLFKASDLLVDKVDQLGWTALFYAAYYGHEESVLLLLKAKAARYHMNFNNQTAIDIANMLSFSQISAIIESDPYVVHMHDVCLDGKLMHAIALCKQGCPPNYRDERKGKNKQTPLIAASRGGHVDVVKMLLRIPIVQQEIDMQDTQGRTALMLAAGVGALDVTAVLLNAGSDRNIKCNKGLTAYDYAAKHSYTVMFKFSAQLMIR